MAYVVYININAHAFVFRLRNDPTRSYLLCFVKDAGFPRFVVSKIKYNSEEELEENADWSSRLLHNLSAASLVFKTIEDSMRLVAYEDENQFQNNSVMYESICHLTGNMGGNALNQKRTAVIDEMKAKFENSLRNARMLLRKQEEATRIERENQCKLAEERTKDIGSFANQEKRVDKWTIGGWIADTWKYIRSFVQNLFK
jgi:hypothetical protein